MMYNESHANTGRNTGASSVVGVMMLVSVAVIIAGVVGAFVDGVGGDLHNENPPEVELVQYSDFTSMTLVDNGSYTSMKLVGPQGQESMKITDNLTVPGTKIIIHRKIFNNTDDVEVDNSTLPSYVENDSGGNNLVQEQRCMIRHDKDTVRGVNVSESDIGCSGQVFEKTSRNLSVSTSNFAGDRIPFEYGGYYQVVFMNAERSTSFTFENKDFR